jgi:hypothetical protein
VVVNHLQLPALTKKEKVSMKKILQATGAPVPCGFDDLSDTDADDADDKDDDTNDTNSASLSPGAPIAATALPAADALPLKAALPTEEKCCDDERMCFEELFVSCEAWILKTWNIDLKICKIIRNPWVKLHMHPVATPSTTKALIRFRKALVDHTMGLADLDYMFGWHGTEEANIDSICREGFNPAHRRGQQYGQGEYFGITSTASYGYCKGGSFLLATLIIKGDWVSHTNAVNAYRVNNHMDFTHSYCLPLCIVNFGSPKDAPFPMDCFPVEFKTVEDEHCPLLL